MRNVDILFVGSWKLEAFETRGKAVVTHTYTLKESKSLMRLVVAVDSSRNVPPGGVIPASLIP